MAPLTNLLPWRIRLRKRWLLCWIGSTIFSALIIFSFCYLWYVRLVIYGHQLQTDHHALSARQHSLQAIFLHQQQLLQQDRQQRAQICMQDARRYNVSRWQAILKTIAAQLPEKSWLRSLTWQKKNLILDGVAADYRELAIFENKLKVLRGVFNIQAGPVRDESNKGLFFTFILTPRERESCHLSLISY